ncbi:MAG TPA: hypothetical protein VFR78_21925, partial [Pyrinomonadaceae bacterium]|nr:hypothetical protein [Pyrinomonadaceae bacterium]
MRHLFKSLVAEFHRLPIWIRGLGPWAFVGVGVILFDALDEFAIAIGVLVLGLSAFTVQISDWKPTDERYIAVKKSIYGGAAIGVLVFLGVVFVKRKGQKPWSNIETVNSLMASGGRVIALVYNNVPWRFVFTAAIACVLTWFIARAWFLTRSKPATGNADLASSKDQIAVVDSLRACQDERLHKIAESDRSRIRDLVRVAAIYYDPSFDKAYIVFTFIVFNGSLYSVVISNVIKSGSIRFRFDEEWDWEKFHYKPRFEPENPVLCRARGGCTFVVRQAIRREEADRLKQKDCLIEFGLLQIEYEGLDKSDEIPATKLDL